MSIADRFWGSQQASRTTTRVSFGREAGELDFSALAEAGSVARLEGWTAIELDTGVRGDVVVTRWEVA